MFLFLLTPGLSVGFSIRSSARFSGSSLLALESSSYRACPAVFTRPNRTARRGFSSESGLHADPYAVLLLLHLLPWRSDAQVIASLQGWKRGASTLRSIRDRSQPALAPPRTPVPSAHMSPGTQRGLSSCLLSPPTRGSLRPRTSSLPIFTSPNPYTFEASPHVSPTRVGSLPARAHRVSWPPTALAALLSNSKAASPRLSRRGRRAGGIACPAPWPALGP